jgi:hypothetical protein
MEVGFVIIRPDGKLQKTYDATQTAVITEVYRTREDAEFVASLLFDGGMVVQVQLVEAAALMEAV